MAEKEQPKQSQSLFDDSSRGRTTQVVEHYWNEEVASRRRRTMRWLIPLVVVVVGTWLGVSRHFHVFPFPPVYEEESADDPSSSQNSNVKAFGFEQAKLTIDYVMFDNDIPEESLEEVLYSACACKPSEICLKSHLVYDKNALPELPIHESEEIALYINSTSQFEVDGKTVDLARLTRDSLTMNQLKKIINQEYAKIYGAERLPVFDLAPQKKTAPTTANSQANAAAGEGGNAQQQEETSDSEGGKAEEVKLVLPRMNVEH